MGTESAPGSIKVKSTGQEPFPLGVSKGGNSVVKEGARRPRNEVQNRTNAETYIGFVPTHKSRAGSRLS